MTKFKTSFAAFILAAAGASTALAAGEAFLEPEKAGRDYAIQGEYAVRRGDLKLGCQIVALGDGKFSAVLLPGGLPGAGWDAKTRVVLEGKTEGELTSFASSAHTWTAQHGDKAVFVVLDNGKKMRLRKVERNSPTLGAKPPAGATVLFDGKNTDAWVNPRLTPEGWLMEGTQTKKSFKDFTLHVEFMTSFMPKSRGQSRANSGVFLDGRYEVQVLDSFGLTGENNECGGVYSVKKPDVNMAFPPLTWQTYDIDFTAPVFDAAGKKTKNAVVTVRHNGVKIHDQVEIPHNTAGGQEGPTLGPIQLMNHGDPVRFRNVWVVEK